MRLIWHIFLKDARRLWWAMAPCLGLLAWLAHEDRWRGDWTPSSVEGWLNVLLPFVWALLIGLLIVEDPVVGDREFWLTLPCGWRSMLGAKALFLLAFIHLPHFLAQAAILWARDFSPFACLPHLLWKQLLLFLVLTLPAMALAAVVRNAVQYMLGAVLVVAGVIFVYSRGGQPMGIESIRIDEARVWIALLPVIVIALSIAVLQYARRSTAISRALGLAALLVAGVLFTWLPQVTTAAARCALQPARSEPAVSIRLSSAPYAPPPGVARQATAYLRARRGAMIYLPLDVQGNPVGPLSSVNSLALELRTSSGERLVMPRPGPYASRAPFYGYVYIRPLESFASLTMSTSLYDRAKNAPVTVKGAIEVDYRRRGSSTSIPPMTRADVPELGKCYSLVTEGTAFQPNSLKVDCESPFDIPYTRVTLIHPETGRRWEQTLGDASTVISSPRNTWLSPLNHRTTHFPLVTEEIYAQGPGSHWQVPEEALATSKLEITPEPTTGCKVVKYELPGIDLKRYAPPEK